MQKPPLATLTRQRYSTISDPAPGTLGSLCRLRCGSGGRYRLRCGRCAADLPRTAGPLHAADHVHGCVETRHRLGIPPEAVGALRQVLAQRQPAGRLVAVDHVNRPAHITSRVQAIESNRSDDAEDDGRNDENQLSRFINESAHHQPCQEVQDRGRCAANQRVRDLRDDVLDVVNARRQGRYDGRVGDRRAVVTEDTAAHDRRSVSATAKAPIVMAMGMAIGNKIAKVPQEVPVEKR